MKISTAGEITQLSITSVVDTVDLTAPGPADTVILLAIKQTDHKWINHSGHDQLVNLPVYIVYRDESIPRKRIPIIVAKEYINWNKTEIAYFEPIIIQAYPPVSKISIE